MKKIRLGDTVTLNTDRRWRAVVTAINWNGSVRLNRSICGFQWWNVQDLQTVRRKARPTSSPS